MNSRCEKELLTADLILNIIGDVGSDWHDLGIALGIEETKVRNLEQDYQKVRERARRVLERKKTGQKLLWDVLPVPLLRLDVKRLQISCSVCKWPSLGD